MRLIIILNILLLILPCPTFAYSKEDDVLNLENSLITASDNLITNTLETSIDINQFGTYLLHLPSVITYKYTSYINEAGTMSNTSMPNKTNTTVSKTNKSSSTTTNPHITRTTPSNSSKYNYSTHYTSILSNFKTKSSLGSGNQRTIATPIEKLSSILYLIFFLF